MSLKSINNADIYLVEIKNGTPHCKKHGAMNKLTKNGIWRCVATYRIDDSDKNNIKFIGNDCKAGCEVV